MAPNRAKSAFMFYQSDHLGDYEAALTRLDYCEHHPAEAHAVNAAAPAHLAALCAERRARFIHLSTDYVYDGSSPGLRRESDPCLPLSIYALTKRDAEQAVLAAHPDFLVARASWIYGPDRPSFPDAIIQRAQNASHGLAIADKWSSPSYSRDLALQLEALLLNPDARGLVNLCNAGSCSWLEYGQAALDLAHQAGVPLRCRTLSPQTCAEMPGFLAQRPRHTAMDSSRLAALTGLTPRPWRDALADYINTYYGRA